MDKQFRIVHENFGKQKLIKLLDSKTQEYISILPETGGMLFSFKLLFENKLVQVLDTYTDEEELIKTLGNSYKGSLLHPFPNRIDAGKYTFDSVNYQLPVNFPHENNSIHGLVFDKPFTIVEELELQDAAVLTLSYISNEEEFGYPFSYELTIVYSFKLNEGVSIETTVKNTGIKPIPVGNGWHPYFKLISNVDELLFSFPAIELYEVDERMLPTGKKNNYTKFKSSRIVKNDSFDSCFGLKAENGKAIITIFDPLLDDGLSIWQETGESKYNFLQIYTPPSRKTIAIEPMTCIPDSFNNNIGLCFLEPNQKSSVSWGIRKLKS